ncbi:MAG TPA: response regulator transcription factor [Acidimicrobiales bacterium]|nr:response regulator transcription factor [Acidimicrobiales bacterium]
MRDNGPNRLIVIDDDALLAQLLAIELGAEGLDVEIAAGPTVESVLQQVRTLAPVVVLLDLNLGPPLGSGLDLIGPLRQAGGQVLMMTTDQNGAHLAACVEAGAIGIVDKASGFHDLVAAVCHAIAGEQVLSEGQRQDFVSILRAQRLADGMRLAPFASLTPREQLVLAALMAGEAADAIAVRSNVSLATIRSQIHAVLLKLGVNSQLAAVALAQRQRWALGSSG